MSAASTSASPPVVKVSRRVLAWLSVVWLLPWITLWFWLFQSDPTATPVAPNSAPDRQLESRPVLPSEFTVSEGPWGRLETYPVVIKAPAELLEISANPVTQTRWRFEGYSPEDLRRLWEEVELPDKTARHLGNIVNWDVSEGRIQVTVPREMVLGLPNLARQRIYAVLAQWSANPLHYAPFSFRADSSHDWFGDAKLSQDTRNLIEPLLYRRGNSLLFSDLPLIYPDIPSADERLELVAALSRSITPLARIRINGGSDIDAIAEYWSMGQRRRDIEPLLRSLPRSGEGTTIDVIHLLPNVPRRLLYTFPEPLRPGQTPFRDCHWTALNFHRSEIDDRFADLGLVRREYETAYREVAGDPKLGDLLLFIREDGSVLHACVHVAADLVFTKNGVGITSPWILMHLEDLLDRYPSDIPFRIQTMRRRGTE